jgi:hypothetical protein
MNYIIPVSFYKCNICLLYVQKVEGENEVRVFLCLKKDHVMKAYEGVHRIRVSGQLRPFHSWLEL